MSQSGFYSSYKCLRERFGQTTVITLPKSLVHSGNKFVYFISSTVNVLKFQTPFLFLSLNKILVIRPGNHKMYVRLANRDDPDQTASSEAV